MGRRKTGENRTCEVCEVSFYVPGWQLADTRFRGGRFCSIACKAEWQRSLVKPIEERASYVNKQGYVMVPVTSGREQNNYRAEHRLVAERMLGRPLVSGEQVHHIDGDKANNADSNLLVLSNSEHQKLHDWPIVQSSRVTLTCKRCGADYERRRSRVAESNCCSATCRLEVQHEGARAYWAMRRNGPLPGRE